MTNAELIEHLTRFPSDALIVLGSQSEETGEIWNYTPLQSASLTLALRDEAGGYTHATDAAKGGRTVVVLR